MKRTPLKRKRKTPTEKQDRLAIERAMHRLTVQIENGLRRFEDRFPRVEITGLSLDTDMGVNLRAKKVRGKRRPWPLTIAIRRVE